ncbi:helix-turn-helix domain-containing protein [Microbispora sp. NPDC004025]
MTDHRDCRGLIVGLVARTNQLGITRQALADALGVTRYTVNAWFRGEYLPSFAHTAAWAQHIGLRLAVVENGRVLSQGEDIPDDLGWLRRRQNLSQRDVAGRGYVSKAVISKRERMTEPGLVTVHDHVTLLGYRLTLLHAEPAAVGA